MNASVRRGCGCGATSALPYRTPQEYREAANRFVAIGSTRAPSAQRAASVAYATARASRRGDARAALAGLRELRALADAEQDQIRTLERQLSTRAGTIRGRIQMVAQLASGVANIIGLATRDPNVMKVIRWIDYIMGVNPSPPEQLNFRELAEFCRVWNGGVGVAALAGVRGIAAVAAAAGAATRTSSLAELGRIVNEVAGYVEMATQQICALAQTQAPSSEGSSSNPGDAPRPHPAPDPLAEARRRWRIAMSARVLAEAFIKATPNSRNQRIRENAIRNNCKYACDLENAERSYLEAKRAAGQDATIERFSSTVTPSVRPRRYVDGATAPSGCTCGGGADASRGTGSGAAGVAAAAAGVALVAYLSLRA